MSAELRRRWWRVAVIALAGGLAVGGGWAALARNGDAGQNDPPRAALPKEESPVWTRSSAPATIPAVTSADPAPSIAPPTVTAASGTQPAVPPAAPVVPAVPVPPVVTPPVTPAGSGIPIPPLPLPSADKPPALLPVPSSEPPVAPVIPLPTPLTPPAPPAKSAEPTQPLSPVRPDFNLRPGDAGNSVKTDGPPAVPDPKLPVVPPPVMPPVPTVPPALPVLPQPAPVVPVVPVDRPKPADGQNVDSDRYVFPVPSAPATGLRNNPSATTTPGDRTMLATNQTVLAAVIGGALAFAPPPTVRAVPQDKDTRTDAQKIEDLQKEVKRLTELIEGRKDSDGIPIPNTGLREKVRTLEDNVASLQRQLDDMKRSTSLRPGGVGGPVVGKGIVRVVNQYPVEVSIVINNTSYRVAPSKTLDVDVPAGEFTYQLLQTGASPVKSTIKDKEEVTLRIK